MSESDSDLDFESADENPEFASSAGSKNQKTTDSNNVSDTVTKDETLLITENKVSSDNNAKNNSKPKSTDTLTTISSQQFPVDLKEAAGKSNERVQSDGENEGLKDHSTNVSQENKTEIASPPEPDKKDDTSLSKPAQKIDASVLKSDQEVDTSVVNKKVDEPETPKEKQRVVLRLEKKMHQKKQLSYESPAEKEKASDLINILHDLNNAKQSSWGFSSWGTSLLSSAASSVTTFSSQVTQGIGTVLETVECTLGAPPPEELATILNEKKAEAKGDTSTKEESEERVSILPDVSSWTKVLENTGSKVIMGGLDTLELIGKKTMDILTEGDPGLRKKRAAFSPGENLSEILREAKAKADEDRENDADDADNIHYSQIFDEKQGLVHLEALEMLSKQSHAKFQRLLLRHSKNSDVKKELEEIRSICENIPSLDDPSDCDSFEDFEAVFKKYMLELSLPLNVENIIKAQRQISTTIKNYEDSSEDSHNSPKEIFQSAICSLAEFTAKCIETFHKVAELILVQPNLDTDLEHCATNLTGLATVMCIEVNNLSSRYHKCLETAAEYFQNNASSENVDINTLATNLYVEASNSNNYIQDAYQMLVPVLQVCLLEAID